MTPKGRRLHLIDKHKYPPNFYFAVTNYGIGRLLMKWGEGVSLLRNEWKPRSNNNVDTDASHDRAETTTTAEIATAITHRPEDDGDDIKILDESQSPRYCTPKAFITPPTATIRIGAPLATLDTERQSFGDSAVLSQPQNMTGASRKQPDLEVDALAESISSLSLIPPAI